MKLKAERQPRSPTWVVVAILLFLLWANGVVWLGDWRVRGKQRERDRERAIQHWITLGHCPVCHRKLSADWPGCLRCN